MPQARRVATVVVSFLAVALIATACDPNPEPETACTVGANGGNPVIVVGGTFSPGFANEAFLGNSLEAAGFTHCIFELKGDDDLGNLPGTMPIEISGYALKLFIEDVLDWSGADQVDLVGHSQGALAARAAVALYGAEDDVDKLISLAGPNTGTDAAALVELLVGPVLAPFGVDCDDVAPCHQMQQESDFIEMLNAGGLTPGDVDYYAFTTDNDELVWYWGTGPLGLPVVRHDNAELGPGATNLDVDDMCLVRVVGHLGMIVDPVPIHMVIDALNGDPIDVPLATCLLPPVVI
ncbi:MAG: hypothetical protein R8F63_21100 [Acidimicrobiales bacterium]|nr:hypothetical protein [Acidimicrobiales bacterium]